MLLFFLIDAYILGPLFVYMPETILDKTLRKHFTNVGCWHVCPAVDLRHCHVMSLVPEAVMSGSIKTQTGGHCFTGESSFTAFNLQQLYFTVS